MGARGTSEHEPRGDARDGRGRRGRRVARAATVGGAIAALVAACSSGAGTTADRAAPQPAGTGAAAAPAAVTTTPTESPTTRASTPTKRAARSKPSARPSARPSATRRPATPPLRRTTPKPKPTSSPEPAPKPAPPAATGGMTSTEAAVLRLVNAERAKAGCGALRSNAVLLAVARAHSRDMGVHRYFAHDSQDGRSPFDRMRAAGYRGGLMGENIAAGQPTPAAVMKSWMNSPGHRANILNCGFRVIGMGVAKVSGSPFGIYWTQDFGDR